MVHGILHLTKIGDSNNFFVIFIEELRVSWDCRVLWNSNVSLWKRTATKRHYHKQHKNDAIMFRNIFFIVKLIMIYNQILIVYHVRFVFQFMIRNNKQTVFFFFKIGRIWLQEIPLLNTLHCFLGDLDLYWDL